MSSLILESLLVERFRTFDKLQIPELGKVNLIVGRNSVGKTCLLEALWLYARRGNPSVIWEILTRRDEYKEILARTFDFDEAFAAISYMFHGREEIKQHSDKIRIGSSNIADNNVTISIDYYATRINTDGTRNLEIMPSEEIIEIEDLQPRFTVELNSRLHQTYTINPSLYKRSSVQRSFEEIRSVFVSTSGIGKRQLAALWDAIALTDLEDEVSSALRVIDKNIERISMVGERERDSAIYRYPIAKIREAKRPFPLRSLGDGMSRALGIALSLVNSSNGILLVDEFENGLHYSIQLDLWKLIFRIAKSLNIQVFATSHSWDCISTFQQAASDDTDQQGMLIRLERKKDEIAATLFNERKLSIATREQIEVR
ncbi:MAG: hypothetical protein EI684_03100 [Candidatus Viridilinea halotolerans]|uniref:ATPase AAA-type core domain-containing protein n=1 Tax=Candidatus Viridilinea halotolerans TaxID=2491704 RepID=A0A426U808_9CHLR|nr:MAG: hypothetical protein EI684_03100 [Candidatus Viridilinea halotolerans]